MAYYLEKSARCTKCGTAGWEWDPADGGNKFAYEAVEDFCPGCLRLDTANEDIGQKHGVSAKLIATNTKDYLKRQKLVEERWMEDMRQKASSK